MTIEMRILVLFIFDEFYFDCILNRCQSPFHPYNNKHMKSFENLKRDLLSKDMNPKKICDWNNAEEV